MPDNETPIGQLMHLLAGMITQQRAGNAAWQAQIPDAMALMDLITDPDEQRHIQDIMVQWQRVIAGERTALQAELLLAQVQQPEQED